ILQSLPGMLGKAERYCDEKKINPNVLLNARLYPDMLPLTRQVQLVCDMAAKACAYLAASEIPVSADDETTFEQLQQRLARTTQYVKAFAPAQFDGAERRDITFPVAPGKNMTVIGQRFFNHFILPNFYFHAAIAHGILRHNGVDIGKADFLGMG